MKKRIAILLFLFLVLAFTVSYASMELNASGSTAPFDLSDPNAIPIFNLPESLEIIEDEAFEGTAIVRIELPEMVSIIGERAFANISTLRSIRIPLATQSIAASAFAGSSQITI